MLLMLFAAVDAVRADTPAAVETVRTDNTAPPPLSLAPPDGSQVKENLKNLLRDPRNRPRRTFWQWLADKLDDFNGPDMKLGTLGEILVAFVIIWCVLTLLAILIHLCWTLSIYLRPNRTPALRKGPRKQTLIHYSYEQLMDMAAQKAQAGDYRGAIGCAALAMIRWLDERKVLIYHESKTNREYVREFAQNCPDRHDFSEFLRLFDQTVYGHLYDENQAYRRLVNMMEQIQGHVESRE